MISSHLVVVQDQQLLRREVSEPHLDLIHVQPALHHPLEIEVGVDAVPLEAPGIGVVLRALVYTGPEEASEAIDPARQLWAAGPSADVERRPGRVLHPGGGGAAAPADDLERAVDGAQLPDLPSDLN